MSTLAERVRVARVAAGLSQTQAASAAGIGLSALRNIEQGVTDDPRISTLRQLERALGAQLFSHDPEADTPASAGEESTPESHEPGAASDSSGARLVPTGG